MPIHLDPQSRRRFLGRSLVLTAGAALPPAVRSAEAGVAWALLSDTHIAADPGERSRQGVNMADHLRRVVDELMEEKEALAGVIVDGDCAYIDGQPGDYVTLLDLLSPVEKAGVPIHFTLGNHDDRDVFYESCDESPDRSPVASKHCTVIETPQVDWILLDSLRYVNQVEGEFGDEQREWLAQRLRRRPGKPAILVGHHYPQVFRTDVIPSEEEIKISGLVDSEPFLEMLAEHPAAKAYVFGHSHDWHTETDGNGVHRINLPPTAYVFRPERPSGWVKATVGESGLQLELRSLDRDHPQHGEVRELRW